MKKNKIQALLFVLFSIGLSACSNEDIYDFPGTSDKVVYMGMSSNILNSYNLAKFNVLKTPVSIVSTAKVKLPVFITAKATNDISINISIDNSLVDTYNLEHSKNYKKVPEDVIAFENENLTIQAGDLISKDSVSVSLNDEKLKSLEIGEYLIPIAINSVKGAKSSSNRNKVFMLISVSEDKEFIWKDGVPYGTLLTTNRPTWTINFDPIPKYPNGKDDKIFDGVNPTTWGENWSGQINAPTTAIIDMQEVKSNITGLFFRNILSGSTLYSSNDKSNWTELGRVRNASSNIVFYAPITARYIRWDIPFAGTNGKYLYLYEISIYQK